MPITINGSGTVTGISAGGLPDGVITRPEMGYAGAVLQVVNAKISTQATSTTSAFADTGLTATITPTSASSKVLVLVNHAGCYKSVGNTSMQLQLLRGATILTQLERAGGFNNTTTPNNFGTVSSCYLDSPSTTSAVTYKTQFASQANINGVTINQSDGAVTSESTITLMEIAA